MEKLSVPQVNHQQERVKPLGERVKQLEERVNPNRTRVNDCSPRVTDYSHRIVKKVVELFLTNTYLRLLAFHWD